MKKVKYVALVLLLVLGLIGGAYAMWTDSIEIQGQVETGSINVKFVGHNYSEEVWHYSMYTEPSGPDRTGVMYADLVNYYNYSETLSVTDDVWTVQLKNTIPELVVRKFVKIKNDGTAPVKLDAINLTDTHGTVTPVTIAHQMAVDTGPTQVRLSFHDSSWAPLAMPYELAAGEEKLFCLSVHTFPDALMSQTLTYKVTMDWKLKDPSTP